MQKSSYSANTIYCLLFKFHAVFDIQFPGMVLVTNRHKLIPGAVTIAVASEADPVAFCRDRAVQAYQADVKFKNSYTFDDGKTVNYYIIVKK